MRPHEPYPGPSSAAAALDVPGSPPVALPADVAGPGGTATRIEHLRYELVIRAAGDLTAAETAYQAELLGSTLLGSVYAAADIDRGEALSQFALGFDRYLADRDDCTAHALQKVLRALVVLPTIHSGPSNRPDTDLMKDPAHPPQPSWLAALGAVRLTGTWAYGDEYGDQITYLAAFAYLDPSSGGPEHAVVVLVDRNTGLARDLFLATPASAVLDRLRAADDDDETSYLVPIDPAQLRAATLKVLAAGDSALQSAPATATVLDDDRSGGDLILALARIRSLPTDAAGDPTDGPHDGPADGAPDVAPRTARQNAVGQNAVGRTAPDIPADPPAAFRDSPEAERLVGAPGDAPTLTFCLDLIQRYAGTRPDHDPLRWSPRSVELFLLQWAPRHAVLDRYDRALLPRVLDAWVRWAGRTRGLSPAAVARTVAEIARVRPSFVERVQRDDLRSPEVRAVTQMLADGVDTDDEAAVSVWLSDHDSGDPTIT